MNIFTRTPSIFLRSASLALVLFAASSWVSGPAQAQVDQPTKTIISGTVVFHDPTKFIEFREGRYSSAPFNYPETISLEEIRKVVALFEARTTFRIFSIAFELNWTDGSFDEKRLRVIVCTSRVLGPRRCTAGEQFIIVKGDDGWAVEGEPRLLIVDPLA